MSINYVVPDDLIRLYEPDVLIQATNLTDPSASEINMARLEEVCNAANGIAYGYLATRYTDDSIQVEALTEGFQKAFKSHARSIARFLLDRSSQEVQIEYEKAVEYFQWMAESDRMFAVGGHDVDPGVTEDEVVGSISFSMKPATWSGEKLSQIF
jgi:phage gp36-like protein